MYDLECKVELNEKNGVYRPGQTINCKIVLTLKERALIKSFACKFSGYAKTRWCEPTTTKAVTERKSSEASCVNPTDIFENREDYIAITNYMIGSDAALPHIIDDGQYTFQLSIRLPDHCPPSLECSHGHIRYLIESYIENAEHKILICSHNIKIIQAADLRRCPSLLEPINLNCNESVKCLKFWQRPLRLHVNIPQTGYVPGERISIYVKLSNDSRLPLGDLIYNLNMVTTYKGFKPKTRKLKTKISTKCLLTSTYSLFGSNSNIIEHLISLQVPTIEPTLDQTQCRCLQQMYEVEVIVRTHTTKRSVNARIPIVVGAVSLHDHQNPIDMTYMKASAPPEEVNCETLEKSINMENCDFNKSLSSLTSSSFKEADFMLSKNINKGFKLQKRGSQDNIDENFKPKYLYYNIG